VTDASAACAGCGRPWGRAAAFQLLTPDGPILKCAWCALRHRPMLLRSLAIAAAVGTILLAINQGDLLLHGEWPSSLAWKAPLTYLVPFGVATWGALANSRLRR